jgi:hypothetical protein
MLTDSILKLKIAFAPIPTKGLFFWEGLLFFNDEEYKKVIEGNFIRTMEALPKADIETISYYQEVLKNLREVREEISTDLSARNEVEKIREALMSEAAHEIIIDAMKENLAKQ